MENIKIKSFTDLVAWQEGHRMVLEVYILTKNFPSDERFGLTSQLRRAMVSFTSNVAEGFSRFSPKEKVQFYSIALGSLTESQNQLLLARDLGYITNESFDKLAIQSVRVSKLVRGLMKSVKSLDTRY